MRETRPTDAATALRNSPTSPISGRRSQCCSRLCCASTVAVVVATGKLAIGVFVASALLVRRVAHIVTVDRTVARYAVRGGLFFASSNDVTTQFRTATTPSGSSST